jgi:hypothetical protein
MSRMSEVYMRFLEERRYDKSLTEESHLSKVAYSKGYQPRQPTPKKK